MREPSGAMMGAGVGEMQSMLGMMVKDGHLELEAAQTLSDWADLFVINIYAAMIEQRKPRKRAANTTFPTGDTK